MKNQDKQCPVLVGYGWDIHKFTTSIKGHIFLGGIKIEYNKDIDAHSDGDVILHALVDALLGCMGKGDIGEYFPPSDNQWVDKESSYFLNYVYEMMRREGYQIGNIDITIITELPKMKPYKELIKNNIASMLNMNVQRVNIKAKTNEKLGFIGSGEALEAHVIVSIF